MSFRCLAAGLLVTVAASAAAPAMAQAFSLEAAVGSSKLTSDQGSLDDRATAVGIVGRWGAGHGLGMEAGVRAHGECAVPLGADTFRLSGTSLLAGVTYDLPVGPWTLGARVGAHAWRLNGKIISAGAVLAKTEDSGGGLYYSLGASYAVSERLSIGTYYNVFHLEEGFKVKGLDVRMGYAF